MGNVDIIEAISKVDSLTNKWKIWTNTDEDKLLSLFKKGVVLHELANIFSRTSVAIWRRLAKLLNNEVSNISFYRFYDRDKWTMGNVPVNDLIQWWNVLVSKIAGYIRVKYKKEIKGVDISNWLKSQWILSEFSKEAWKKRTIINDTSEGYWIITEKRKDRKDIEYDAIVFTEVWIQFVLDNIDNIDKYAKEKISNKIEGLG